MTNYWLMKCEPEAYSIDDLKRDKESHWEGVRNYQARNFMRDEMKVGDIAFFYHSNAKPSGIVGLMKVSKKAYPDHFALDPKSKYYDPKATKDNPRWHMVNVRYMKKFPKVLSLAELKEIKGLEDMMVLKKGSRLSIQPVTEKQYKLILEAYGY